MDLVRQAGFASSPCRPLWKVYKPAIEEMLFRTSTPRAPWTIVESNCKWYARGKVLETVAHAIESRL
jgi:polyphosphate kinase 2 (PPK2 family)